MTTKNALAGLASGEGNKQMATTTTDAILDRPDMFANVIDGVHVVVVKISDDRYKRRCYLTLAAADRAADRARERGHEAAVVLCKLTPVRAGWVR